MGAMTGTELHLPRLAWPAGGPRVAACAATVLLSFAAARADESGGSQTRTVPISLPRSMPARIPSIAQRITLTEIERTVLEATKDRTASLEETGLYAMLAVALRARQQVRMDDLEWDQLDRPAYVNLVNDPNRYRATPMRFRMKVSHVWKLAPGAGLTFHPMIPKSATVWQIDGVWSDVPYERNKPMRVYSVVDPEEFIGKPGEVDEKQKRIYDPSPEVRVAGLFYKVYTETDLRGNLRDYPVVMVWQMSRTIPAWGQAGDYDIGKLARLLPLLLLVVVMGGGFIFTRRRLAKMRAAERGGAGPGGMRRTLRQRIGERAAREKADRDTDEDELPPAEPVDPALTAAVEDYLHHKEDEDGADRPG